MSRRITHGGDLGLIPTFCERVRALGERLGPLLIQFPPTRSRDDGLLRLVLDSLDPALRVAFEFRHATWLDADVDDLLDARSAARVGSLGGVSPFRYLRLREPPYDDASLLAWAERLRGVLASGIDVYCYFKHEDDPRGALSAERLLRLVAGEP
jgi:uncharacterized protein YecE (DUF72 family)